MRGSANCARPAGCTPACARSPRRSCASTSGSTGASAATNGTTTSPKTTPPSPRATGSGSPASAPTWLPTPGSTTRSNRRGGSTQPQRTCAAGFPSSPPSRTPPSWTPSKGAASGRCSCRCSVSSPIRSRSSSTKPRPAASWSGTLARSVPPPKGGAAVLFRVLETARLRLEPIRGDHADAMVEGLGDPALYAFALDETPAGRDELRERYERLASGWSPGGDERWLNWIVVACAGGGGGGGG